MTMIPERRTTLGVVLLTILAMGLRAEGISFPEPVGRDVSSPVAQRVHPTPVDQALAQDLYELTSKHPETLKAMIHEVLCTYVENPETVRVAIELGSPIERLAGRLRRVEVSMEGTVIKKLKLDRGFIVLEDVVLDLPKLVREKRFRFREKGETQFFFEVSEAALNTLLAEKERSLKVRGAHLRLENGRMVFEGKMKVLFFNNHLRLDGRLYARNGTQVFFQPRGLKLDFLPIPGFLLGIINRKLNPVADLENFRFKVDIGRIETTKSRIMLGSADVTPYILEQARAERAGEDIAVVAWPPPRFSRMLAAGHELVRSDTSAGAAVAERVLAEH